MYFLDASLDPVDLELLPPALPSVARAGRAFFGLGRQRGNLPARAPKADGPPPAVFRETRSGLLRTFLREIVVRFERGTSERRKQQLLRARGLEVRRTNPYVRRQVVAADRSRLRFGPELVDVANALAQEDGVVFATPNFVSEYCRHLTPPAAQWHLANKGRGGQKRGEDVDVAGAWAVSRGRGVVVAVLDDGVDLEHPAFKGRLWRNPDAKAKDRYGRDFFLPAEHPDHWNPRPKKWRYPYDQMAGNDSHGTPCAGLVAAAGVKARGVAPEARVLPVKIFHADELASDEYVANAIRYAARHARVLSCSWSGGVNADLELAIDDAVGKGAVVVVAAGNGDLDEISFPASHKKAIAVGASTDEGRRAWYSNRGPELAVVAPSSGGVLDVFTTDVSLKDRGFDPGAYTDAFGGTSAAAPMVAGVVALMLAANDALSPRQVKDILRRTAVKIGEGYDAKGHSHELGHGRVDAAAAVAAARAARRAR